MLFRSVLALIVKPLPENLRKKALTYGIVGAIVFRLLSISAAAWLIHWEWVKFVGGGYLVYLPLKYFLDQRRDEEKEAAFARSRERAFWTTVLVVELTDILFAIDSILTAVALSSKLWVVISGGVLGMLAMRMPIALTYDVSLMAASLAIAVVTSGFALHIVGRSTLSVGRLVASSVVMGAGIAAMHYTGMAAMEVTPGITYDPALFAASIVVAVLASLAALWIAFKLRTGSSARALLMRLGAALVMALAI